MYINEAVREAGKTVKLAGWVHRKRESGGIAFIIIRDRTGVLQVAVKKNNVDTHSWEAAENTTIESSVKVEGVVRKDQRAPTGYELEAATFENVQISEPYPITEYQSTELLLDKRHLWLRSRKMTGVMVARAHIFKYAREFLDGEGFFEVTPPTITLAGGETGSNLFEVSYYDKKAYLTESSQLYAEAMVPVLEKIYSLVPAYRAEKSRTTNHLAEPWMLEPEMAYFDSEQSMKLQESMISHIASRFVKNDGDIIELLELDRKELADVKPPFKRISYEKAIELLNGKGAKLKWGDDFGMKEEMLLTEDEKKPVFVTDWAKEIKAFYAYVNPDDPRTVLSDDMQAPHGHGEIIGGTQREWRLDKLTERMREVEEGTGVRFNMDNYEWWLDLRRYGSVPHSGFGMGMERVIKWLLNLDHIRDAIPFPRMSNRLYP